MSSLVTYKTVQIVSPTPTQTGGQALNQNFVSIADSIDTLTTSDAAKVTTAALTSGLATKANTITAGTVGHVLTVAASGQVADSGTALSSLATSASVTSGLATKLTAASNLSDLTNVTTAQTNLGLRGAGFQPALRTAGNTDGYLVQIDSQGMFYGGNLSPEDIALTNAVADLKMGGNSLSMGTGLGYNGGNISVDGGEVTSVNRLSFVTDIGGAGGVIDNLRQITLSGDAPDGQYALNMQSGVIGNLHGVQFQVGSASGTISFDNSEFFSFDRPIFSEGVTLKNGGITIGVDAGFAIRREGESDDEALFYFDGNCCEAFVRWGPVVAYHDFSGSPLIGLASITGKAATGIAGDPGTGAHGANMTIRGCAGAYNADTGGTGGDLSVDAGAGGGANSSPGSPGNLLLGTASNGVTIGQNGTTSTINSDLTFANAKNIAVGTSIGSKIGTATSQKLGFWNTTPCVQPSGANQAAITNSTGGTASFTLSAITAGSTYSQTDITNVKNALASLHRQIDAIRTALVASGMMKGSA